MNSPGLKDSPNVGDWVSLSDEGMLVVHTGKVDIGQRITGAIARIAADELDYPLARIQVEAARTGNAPDEGYTSGSNSIFHSGLAVRAACATLRRYAVTRAAQRFGVAESDIDLENGVIAAPGINQVLPLHELLADEPLTFPVDGAAPLKPVDQYRFVGKEVNERAARQQPGPSHWIDGSARFVHDLQPDGLLHARVVRPPHYHARLAELDESAALPGDTRLVRDGSFLAVASSDEYLALKARDLVARNARWQSERALRADDLFEALTSNPRTSLPVIDGTPQAREVPERPADPPDVGKVHTARYERPYHMHGSIGPSASMALFEGDTLTVWSHTQGVYPLRAALAEALGLAPAQIVVQHTLGAGCYGHNGADDAALDAALIARALPGYPVLLKWTREDEHAWEPYGSAMVVQMRAAVDSQGRILNWEHQSYSDTHINRPRPGPGTCAARLVAARLIATPLEPAPATPRLMYHGGIHRNADPLYRFATKHIVKNLVADLPLRTSSMRTLGAVANVFAIESFLDEIAREHRIDPFELRVRHLDDTRAVAVLERLRECMQRWPASAATGTGRGIGFARYKNDMAYAGIGVEVEVAEDASVRLLRAVVVGDTGQVIDPDGAAAQLEGGFLQAASWSLYEAVGFDTQGITTRDWDSYPILRFDNVPEIEVELIDQPNQTPLGIGEASSGPAVAAIANAIHDACGLRLRRMPFTPDALRAAALA